MWTSIFYKQRVSVLTWVAIFCCHAVFAQSVSLSGPSCVTAGAVYLYAVSAKWGSAAKVRFCVRGGTLADSGGTCAGGSGILSFVRVTWDSGGQALGSVAVTTSQGNDSIAVTIVQPLAPGRIDSGVLIQTLDTATAPATLTCSVPLGGGCSAAYEFQWQQSYDNVIWKNISGETSSQLSFFRPLSQTTYFRRVTTNSVSNAYDLSNVATLRVNTPISAAQE